MKSINFNTNSIVGYENVCRSGVKTRKLACVFLGLAGVVAPAALVVSNLGAVHAETANTTFNVNVRESLAVSIATPSEWASGDVNNFLRNKVSLSVTANSANGFTASMYAQGTTDLTNVNSSSATIPTLANSTVKSSFPSNRWGYSLGSGTIDSSLNNNTYGETDAGNNDSNYYPLVSTSSTPIAILTGTGTGNQDIYFGAKVDMTQASGTYQDTVVISVVTDVVDSSTNPITPTNPATPAQTDQVATYTPAPTGSTSSGSTTYTYHRTTTPPSSSSSVDTTTTEVSEGNNISAYQGYTPPQGVIENTISNVSEGASPLANGLAATSAVAAATGIFFFILAKRKEKDDDEQQA